jgi:beta-phosphoglucomutase-like phosphatase (HAD superfamily)
VDEAMRRLGRPPRDGEREEYLSAWDKITDLPGFLEESARSDTSFDANRDLTIGWMTRVGVAGDLAEASWALNGEPAGWPVFSDAARVVTGIRERGCKTALVSNFHVDVRPHLEANGVVLDASVISFELGLQKPDARMFTTALARIDVSPQEALMVGDRLDLDGGAAAAGIDTLLLPAPPKSGPRGLDVILGMLG